MKKLFSFLIILFLSFSAVAQTGLTVQSNARGMYIPHTVSAKENFYSIGRLYNIPPKDIAAFNNLDMASGLSVGQSIQIPLNATNFSQLTATGTPVYYVVGDKEGLYRVSVNNNKVLMANLRKWNNLTTDVIAPGQRLIVGYLNSPEGGAIAANNTPVRNEPITQPQQTTAQPTTQRPPQTTTTTTATQPQPERTTQPVRETPPAENRPRTTNTQTVSYNDASGGYFRSQFEQQARTGSVNKDITATAGIFKTASGWQDGKYYALMDGVEPGTIVRVINPSNGRTVYAKVLGQMSGIRQNQGLGLRISNAAATVLETGDGEKFMVRVNY